MTDMPVRPDPEPNDDVDADEMGEPEEPTGEHDMAAEFDADSEGGEAS